MESKGKCERTRCPYPHKGKFIKKSTGKKLITKESTVQSKDDDGTSTITIERTRYFDDSSSSSSSSSIGNSKIELTKCKPILIFAQEPSTIIQSSKHHKIIYHQWIEMQLILKKWLKTMKKKLLLHRQENDQNLGNFHHIFRLIEFS